MAIKIALAIGCFLIGLGAGYTWHFKQIEPLLVRTETLLIDMEKTIDKQKIRIEMYRPYVGESVKWQVLYESCIKNSRNNGKLSIKR